MASGFDLEGVDTEELRRLLEMLTGTDIEECEIVQGDQSVKVRRAVEGPATTRAEAPEDASTDRGEDDEPALLTAEAVGIFYRVQKSSDQSPVELGSRVQVGTVLGTINVMNVPHIVRCTREGVVQAFLVDDGMPVEYGQPIVAISG